MTTSKKFGLDNFGLWQTIFLTEGLEIWYNIRAEDYSIPFVWDSYNGELERLDDWSLDERAKASPKKSSETT